MNTKIFQITKEKSKGRMKTFYIECDVEYIKHRIENDKKILVVYLINENEIIPVYSRMFKDKLLSQMGTWEHLSKYTNRQFRQHIIK